MDETLPAQFYDPYQIIRLLGKDWISDIQLGACRTLTVGASGKR